MHAFVLMQTDPLAGVAIVFCLATIFWCIHVVRRRQGGSDRFLLGLLGLLAISQAMGILQNAGIWLPNRSHDLRDLVELVISGLCLIGAVLLEISSRDRILAQRRARLAEANPQPRTDLANPQVAVLVIAQDGTVCGCNRAAEMVLGLRRETLIGMTPFEKALQGQPGCEVSRAEGD
ncbi:MAG TPA: hypothetical protein VKX49_30975 [Bryobacteraceae bacterium]|nr:hypothetical protein [Bryobacteraceae bacterium]